MAHTVVHEGEGDYEQEPNLWFKDRDIVLCVERTLFRIVSVILNNFSTPFMAILSSPWKVSGETYEGFDVIQITDLELEEARYLFYASIFYASYVDNVAVHQFLRCNWGKTAKQYEANAIVLQVIKKLDLLFSIDGKPSQAVYQRLGKLRKDGEIFAQQQI
ncbi:hypothetical protein CPC08DRAFT_729443 [Agrocybe pediades]|nr:hypothetical protein CPC08DRAFT_729443 [Agrocybe pediades]